MLPKDYVDENKRRRCAEAVAELAHAKGVGQVQAGEVIKLARISRTTFYAIFEDREQSFAYSCDLARRQLLAALTPMAELPGARSERVGRTVGALLIAAAEAPRMTELCLVHSVVLPQNPPGVHDPATVAALAEALAPQPLGRGRSRAGRAETFVAEAIVSVVATRLRRGRHEELLQLREQLVEVAMTWLEAENSRAGTEAPRRAA